MKIKKLLNKKAKGSVLFTVLIIMTLAVILGSSALLLSSSMYQRTQKEYCEQQAYYNAEASLNGVVSILTTSPGSDLESLITNLTVGVPSSPYTITGLNGDSSYVTFEKKK